MLSTRWGESWVHLEAQCTNCKNRDWFITSIAMGDVQLHWIGEKKNGTLQRKGGRMMYSRLYRRVLKFFLPDDTK